MKTAKEQKIPIAFKLLDTAKSQPWALADETRFVANFSSVKDAKTFYDSLRQSPEYKRMKPDRTHDYQGHQLDDIAHYASGYKETRASLQRIEKAVRNPDGTYTYQSQHNKPITISEPEYNAFMAQLRAMPDPKATWENA